MNQKLKNEKDTVSFLSKNREIINILTEVRDLRLPDCWICAGFLRILIWDYQSGSSHHTLGHDLDVVYFDNSKIDLNYEQEMEAHLKNIEPTYHWEVKNEARMHTHNPKTAPYSSAVDAISKFPETATSIGARLDWNNKLILTAPHGVNDLLNMTAPHGVNDLLNMTAPHGVNDLLNMTVHPTPFTLKSKQRMKVYKKRIMQKKWQTIWHQLKIEMN